MGFFATINEHLDYNDQTPADHQVLVMTAVV